MGSPWFMAKLVGSEYLSATVTAAIDDHAAQCASANFRAVSMSGIMKIHTPWLPVENSLHEIIGNRTLVNLKNRLS